MNLCVLSIRLAVVRLNRIDKIPSWALSRKNFLSITYTDDELSIVCDQQLVPDSIQCEKDWRALKIVGPLDFSLVGILAPIATLLAQQSIPIFALSTFDTDYIFVKNPLLPQAQQALLQAGYNFV
jgi:hypothetical protein